MFLTVDNSENEFNKKETESWNQAHGGQTGRQMWVLRNYLCIFLSLWAQSLQDGRTLYSKQSYVVCFSIFMAFGEKMTSQDWQQN